MTDESHSPSPLVPRGEHGMYVVTEAALEKIEALAAGGHPFVGIAQQLGMNRDTFRALRKRDPRVDEAVARGRGLLEMELTNILLDQAREGNTTAAIWLSKAVLGWHETGPKGEGQTNNIQIVLPRAMTPDEYMQSLRAEGAIDTTEEPTE